MDLQKEFNLSYVIIAHDLAVIHYVCDRIAVMYLGRIVEIASCRDLYRDPRHPYTRALLTAVPQPDPHVSRQAAIVKGDVPSPIAPPSGCHFHPRCSRRLDICDQAVPRLRAVGENHQAACHLYGGQPMS